MIESWRSLRPSKKFLSLTVDEFGAKYKGCIKIRDEIKDLDRSVVPTANRRTGKLHSLLIAPQSHAKPITVCHRSRLAGMVLVTNP